MEFNCPFCDKGAEYGNHPGTESMLLTCPRCGRYDITTSALSVYASSLPLPRYHVSGVLRYLSEAGIHSSIHSANLNEILQSVAIPPTPLEGVDLLLAFVERHMDNLVRGATIDKDNDYPVVFAKSPQEFQYYIDLAERTLKLIRLGGSGYIPTVEGWRRLQELKTRRRKANQAFVAMWFDDSVEEAWSKGISAALIECGFDPIRIDFKEHNGKICDRIIAEIRTSGLLIADFTGQRGGVYFEAGFAMGLGIPVVWSCRKDEVDRLHFDTRQYNHIVWSDAEDLRLQLANRIRATIPVV